MTHPKYSPETILTVKEFAAAVGLSYWTVSRAVTNKKLPAHKIAGTIRIIWGEAMERTSNMAPAGGRVWN